MHHPHRVLSLILTGLIVFGLSACTTGRHAVQVPTETPVQTEPDETARVEPPSPYVFEIPDNYLAAVENDTRTLSGRPGADYWQQEASYDLRAAIYPEEKRLEGQATIRYTNNSPDVLRTLHLELAQNLHKEGAIRSGFAEVTGGVDLNRVAMNGTDLEGGITSPRQSGYAEQGTQLIIVPPTPVQPGETVELAIDWSFTIPQAGASGRMGYSRDDLFFLAYWYPIVSVYDDVVGWYGDQFTGGAEFYANFADYTIEIEAPNDWIVQSTGSLLNEEEVLQPDALERLRSARQSDEPVMISTPEENPVRQDRGERLTWRFEAEQVRDVAFNLSKDGFWEGARTPVGDRDSDGETEYAEIYSFWRPEAPLWSEMTRYQQHSLAFQSEYTEQPYPWPHMTAVEGAEIIGGGMEFPMMTLMGDYATRGDTALYAVTAHELAHMWVPMLVSTNERRFSWIDEGMTTFLENQSKDDFYPGTDWYRSDQQIYLNVARQDMEGPLMRRSDYHYPGPAFVIASYQKPATLLRALKGVLGEEVFYEAYTSFFDRWVYSHPYPWDLFNTFESVADRDLDWFWTSYYYETWKLDQSVESVVQNDGTTEVVIANNERAVMPADVVVTFADGETAERRIPAETWTEGYEERTLTFEHDAAVERVEIDPLEYYPDVDRDNNVWTRTGS